MLCKSCDQELPVESFAVADPKTGRRKNACRQCNSTGDAARRLDDLDRYRATKRLHYQGHRDEYFAKARRWRSENPDAARLASRNAQAKRRALAKAAYVEQVDYAEVWRQSRGICGLCGARVRSMDEGSVDHILPLSRGGDHSYANVHLAHRSCNSSKRDRPMNEQLRLV